MLDSDYTQTLLDDDDDNQATDAHLNSQSKKIKKESFKQNSVLKKNSIMKVKTKRNPWQPEEDEQVMELVVKYGQSWALIASLMKDRSGKQIRDRYLNKLKPDINKAEWTQKEDELVMSLCKEMGHKWSRIATFLPGRTEGQVKNRFYSHIKKRMSKWLSQSNYNYQKSMEEANDSDQENQDNKDNLEREMKIEEKARNPIQTLNCAGEYKIVNSMEESVRIPKLSTSSINIKLNTFDSKEINQGKRGFTYNVISSGSTTNVSARDPTDVISYVGKEISPAKTDSPFSQKSGFQLASTRASSLSQEKEFEEAIDKMAGSIVKPLAKLHGISFSISNGSIVSSSGKNVSKTVDCVQNNEVKKAATTGNSLSAKSMKEVNQLSFSGVQNMINIRIC